MLDYCKGNEFEYATHFHLNGCAPGLALKLRHAATGKWAVICLSACGLDSEQSLFRRARRKEIKRGRVKSGRTLSSTVLARPIFRSLFSFLPGAKLQLCKFGERNPFMGRPWGRHYEGLL